MTTVKSSYHGRARRAAFELWRGPDYMRNQDDDHPWSGLCVLRLAMRQDTEKQIMIEARAAYTYLAHEDQQNAILRAVYWDSQTTVGKSRDDTSPIKIPARFVQIPVSLVQQWLRAFDTVQTSIRMFAHADDSLPICSLRVETESVNCAFEKVWQVVEGEDSELNRLWQDTWQQMGQSLQTAPSVAGLEESFHCVKVEPDSYDFQAYTPSLRLP